MDRLTSALTAIPDLAIELETTVARLNRAGHGFVTRSSEVPLPFNAAASAVRDDLRNVLSTWVRDLWETYGPHHVVPTDEIKPNGDPVLIALPEPLDLPNRLPEMAAWLRRHPSWMAGHPAAGELVDEILDAVDRARRAIDLPPERIYCGPCPRCSSDLYARPDRADVTCHECDTRHDVAELRTGLLAAARDRLATATEIARALPGLLGRELSANTVRTWAYNGRLTRRKPDEHGRPRYRIGDVIDLALSTPSRVTRKPAKCA